MSQRLIDALGEVATRLASLATQDATLRAALQTLAHALLEATEEAELAAAPRHGAAAASAPEPSAESRSPKPMERQAAPSELATGRILPSHVAPVGRDLGTGPRPDEREAPLPELTFARSSSEALPVLERHLPRRGVPTLADFPVIEARCRLKAEAARWAAKRRRLLAEGATYATEIEPKDRDIIARAKQLPDCFLWMCHPSGPNPSDLCLYEHVAGSFEAIADVLALLKQVCDDPDRFQTTFEQSLDLLAEAQSALRVAIDAIDGPKDQDQVQVYNWLRATASERQIFIQRYMRIDDPADPKAWAELVSRIEAADAAMQETQRRTKQRRKLLGKVRHKVSLIEKYPDDAQEHWSAVAAVVDELIADGLPPSHRELRELLLPVIEELPEMGSRPRGFELVLREIDRFMATCPPPEPATPAPPSAEVLEVARLLEGRSAVLIGGERRPESDRALREAFRLQRLIWLEGREPSVDKFEPHVARPEVAVVLLAIRWSSHSFGDVRLFCERYGKPLVRLPGGYNPNQVAVQILEQCSERLRAELESRS